jgi:hypothetical protein
MARSVVRSARLMTACRRRGQSNTEAEDLIQEAFLRLHQYRPGTVRQQDSLNLAKHNHLSEQWIAGGMTVCPA